jgi:hypothetical protein
VKGRGFVRELQASGASAQAGPPAGEEAGGAIEGGGYLVSAQTAAELRTVDLTKSTMRAGRRALLVARDQASPEDPLARRLAELGIAHDVESGSGWNDMMTESQFSQVPHATLETITAWIAARAREAAAAPAAPSGADRIAALRVFAQEPGGPAIEETPHRFGPRMALFGILGRASPDTTRPVVVLFNAGGRASRRPAPALRGDRTGTGRARVRHVALRPREPRRQRAARRRAREPSLSR